MYLANDQYQEQHKSKLESNDWLKWSENNKSIDGGGFAMKLYKCIGQTIPSCIFFKYTAEGDNRSDAVEVVAQLNLLIDDLLQKAGGDKINLTVPVSWKAMFGNDPTEQIYWTSIYILLLMEFLVNKWMVEPFGLRLIVFFVILT